MIAVDATQTAVHIQPALTAAWLTYLLVREIASRCFNFGKRKLVDHHP